MKLRFNRSSSNIILNKEQTFRSNAGWDENFQTYEDEVLESIINPIENYETNRYIHKPYISNNIEQTDIWFYFYFVSGGTYTLDYKPVGISQTDTLLSDLKNSFFRLEFYKTPNNEAPNRSNRRLVFAKNLSTPVGERISVTGKLEKVYVPVFVGSTLRNKENMYLFWFHDDSVLEETLLTGTTFYMTAKFYNAVDGSRLQFANKEITNSATLVEEEDLYFRVQMNRTNEPSFHYVITEINDCDQGANFQEVGQSGQEGSSAQRVGTSSSPIKFYEIGNGEVSGSSATATPTPTPSNTSTPTPTPTPTTNNTTPTPLPIYYRFENCDTGELVFQTMGNEPISNARYTDGVTNFIYDGTSTTQPGTIVTNLSGPIGTGCEDVIPTATPTPVTQNVEIQECGGFTVWYVTIVGSTYAQGMALKLLSAGGTLDGSKCWEITNSNYTGSIDFEVTVVGSPYLSCSSCVSTLTTPTATPITLTPTPTPIIPTPTPTPTAISFTAYLVNYSSDAGAGDVVTCGDNGTNITVYSLCTTLNLPGDGPCYLYSTPDINDPAPTGWYKDHNTSQAWYIESNTGLIEDMIMCNVGMPTATPEPLKQCQSLSRSDGQVSSTNICSVDENFSTLYYRGDSPSLPEVGDTAYREVDCGGGYAPSGYYKIAGQYWIQIQSNGYISQVVGCTQ